MKFLSFTILVACLLVGCNSATPSGKKPETSENAAKIEQLEFKKALIEDGRPYKARIEAVIAKYKAKLSSDPEQAQKDLDAYDVEMKPLVEEAKEAGINFELKWRKDHPGFSMP